MLGPEDTTEGFLACQFGTDIDDQGALTWWTSDLDKRLAAHGAGTASRYTRSRLPVTLALALPQPDRSTAMREEARIKRLPRAEKVALVAGTRPS